MAAERRFGRAGLRVFLKAAQFLCSLALLACLYRLGPHWVLMLTCLLVPPYGLFLLLKRARPPDPRLTGSLPFLNYKLQRRARSWLKADLAISLTMSCVMFGFACVLLLGFFTVRSASPAFLEGAVAAVCLALLYALDALLAARRLSSASVQFLPEPPVSTQPVDDHSHDIFSENTMSLCPCCAFRQCTVALLTLLIFSPL